jgi:pimeloyl-ACP methyl ester carboxylesterase
MLIKTNGISLDYRDGGAGIPVIFIHAFPLNQSMWDDQLVALQDYCRTITLDLRGFGQSDAPQGPYTMDQMGADVRGLMTALDIDRAVFVGLSMGGYVTLSIHRNYPDSVRALVLADTRAGADTSEARERRLKSAAKVEANGSRAIAEDMIPLLLGQTTRAGRPDVVERVRSMIEANSPVGIAGAQRGMAERRDSTDLLPAIAVPTLILVGAEDTLTNVDEATNLAAAIRGARLRVIERAGHLSNLESPAAFNAPLIEFLVTLNQLADG